MLILIQQAVERFGAENVMVSSFTKTAAREIAGRDTTGVRAATLHSHCWHGLDRPTIAETCLSAAPKGADDAFVPWNRAYPNYALTSSGKVDLDDAWAEESSVSEGDALMGLMQRYRAAMTPRSEWEDRVLWFAERWDDWKAQHGLLDFSDLIETAIAELPYAPGNPTVGFVDEAQDMAPLQLKLLRSWGQFMNYLVLSGDDDQTIFEWAGCTPHAFLEPPIPVDWETVLAQSYRVPRAVHARAQRWIEKVTYRKVKEYRPRDADGRLMRSGATWRHPEALVKDAARRAAEGETVMFLASCGYMLQPLLSQLREAGLPFHNPYRLNQGAWNPLRLGGRGAVSAADRLLAFQRPDAGAWGENARMWSYRELAQIVAPLRTEGVLLRGAKTEIEGKKAEPGLVSWEQLSGWFTEHALEGLYNGDVQWYHDRMLATKQKAYDFPLRVLGTRGVEGLRETPKVTVGTIHSVKGGEASCVYLWPDLSQKGYYGAWQSGRAEDRDAVRRLFYVGMTRARDTLVLCSPTTHMSVDGL